jgi:nucleoside-diphosphate-sugar epimerase
LKWYRDVRLLISGGTRFAGRQLAECALACGHAITLFNRGQSKPDPFPQVEQPNLRLRAARGDGAACS